MALIKTKSSDTPQALRHITAEGIEAVEKIDGIEVADADADQASSVLAENYIVHLIDY